jgi:hypothetical protein
MGFLGYLNVFFVSDIRTHHGNIHSQQYPKAVVGRDRAGLSPFFARRQVVL